MATSVTNLDINSIVSQLMTVERQPLAKLSTKEASYQAKLSAYSSLKGAVSSFQSALQSLSNAGSFEPFKVTSSDASIFSATAANTAVAGSYALEVSSLAQAQKLAATGQPSSTAAIGTGTPTTVTFDFGTLSGGTFDSGTGHYSGATFTSNGNGTRSITIDSSNNSLQGIRDAVNAAGMGVTATLINDGSGAPWRLALSADNKGASNSIKITVNGDAAVESLLAHDPAGTQNLAETVAAQNASFKVNGVAVSKASNTVSDVIQGVTLTLKQTTASPETLTVERDTAAVSSSIGDFVKAYNDLATTLKNLSSYDAVSQKGAILQGDSTVLSLQAQMRKLFNTPLPGASGGLKTLSDIGITFQTDGSLAVKQTKLNSVMASNFGDIASLFATVGKATDSLVSYSNATGSTKAGSYAVNVTQLATRGTAVGSTAANTTITAGVNDALTLAVDGINASIVLSAGTYTAQALATELQSRINGSSALSAAGITVSVTQNAGSLSITSSSYGSSSRVAITGGNGAAGLLGTPVETPGVDVAGSIGGVAASGSGQTLTASSGDPQGLSLVINGGATGARGTLNYSRGYATLLGNWAASVVASDGILANRTDGIGRSISDIGKQRDNLEARLINIEKRYRAQFTALDKMLSSMDATSTFLTQQITQLSRLN